MIVLFMYIVHVHVVPVYGAKVIELEDQDIKEKQIHLGQLLNMLFLMHHVIMLTFL